MTSSKLAKMIIAQRFDRAAENYDEAASVQAQIAARLVQMAAQNMPRLAAAILDIGCGTGFAAAAAARRWPQARITAIDSASAMLEQARRKVPDLQIMKGDIAAMEFDPAFDLILSSMALHWLPEPRAALMRWQKGLKPQGRLFAATLVAGSFEEWRQLCAAEKLADGLWPMPRPDFADGIAPATELQMITADYPSAKDFLRRLKTIGAATPKPGHKPLDIPRMRRLLASASTLFTVTYRVLYIEMQSPGSI